MKSYRRRVARKTLVRGLGALLVLAGLALAALTEHSVLDYHSAMAQRGNAVLDFGADGRPQAGQFGSTTRVSGLPKIVEQPRDEQFGQHAASPVLLRHVEMFQWREVRVGGAVHYELDWVDRPLDTAGFEQPRGHANPGAFPIEGKQFDAGQVRLGNFVLSTPLLHAMPGSEDLAPDMKAVPPNFAATFQLYEGALVTSAHPASPRLGDLRVSWKTVPLQEITVLARIDGDTLVPAAHPADGGPGFEVQVGDRALLDVAPDMPEPPALVALRRGLALLLVAIGVFVLAERLRMHRDPLFALATSAIVVGAITCVLWLGTSMLDAAGWLALALAGIALASWRVHRRSPGEN
jgi:hypothetical protein